MLNKEKIINVAKYLAKPIGAIVICLIVVFIAGDRISAISADSQSHSTASKILENRIETIGTIENDFKKIGEVNYEKIENIFPTTDSVPDIALAFDGLAKTAGIKINQGFGSSPVPTNFDIQDPNYKIVSVDYNASATSNVTGFIRFLKALEQANYFVTLSRINISGSNWDTESSISISGKIYLKQSLR